MALGLLLGTHHHGSPLLEYVYRVLFIEYGKDYLAQLLRPSLVMNTGEAVGARSLE